jgi:hypothetical protein
VRSLVVTTPATDLTLLTIDELRFAAGVTDGSRDTELRNIEARVAASIMSECNIAIGAGAEPTLRRETLTETIYGPHSSNLMLSRRHNVTVASVSLDSVTVAATDWVVESEKGFVSRLIGGYPCHWWGITAVVVYDAGFTVVPGDLKQAAMDYFRAVLAEAERDPFVKSLSQDVPGVMSETRDFWVGSIPGQVNAGPVPDVVAGQLKRFRNYVIG